MFIIGKAMNMLKLDLQNGMKFMEQILLQVVSLLGI
jgi:hypothetical protein